MIILSTYAWNPASDRAAVAPDNTAHTMTSGLKNYYLVPVWP